MSRVKVKFHSFPHYFYLTWRCKIFCDNQRIKFERKLAHNWLIILWSDNLESKLWSPKCTKCTQNSILSVFRLFFGRIEKTINCYRDLLTFNVRSEKKNTKRSSNTLLRLVFFFRNGRYQWNTSKSKEFSLIQHFYCNNIFIGKLMMISNYWN